MPPGPPTAAEALTGAPSGVLPARTSCLLAYLLYDVLAICFLRVMLLPWLRTWFDREPAMVGFLLWNTTPSSLFRTLVNGCLLLGGCWAFVWLGYQHTPRCIPQLVPLGLSPLYPPQQESLHAGRVLPG